MAELTKETNKKEKTNGKETTLTRAGVFNKVSGQIRSLMEAGEIDLPEDYSAENALKAAWLALQSVEDKSKRPALAVCTQASVYNSLLDMVVQGLNPAKKQCAFIVYGNQLQMAREYLGTMCLLKRVFPGAEVFAQTVYEGDDFKYAVEKGRKRIEKHVQSMESLQKGKIAGAYAIIEIPVRDPHVEVMTLDQIVKAWKQNKGYGSDGTSAHQKFPDRMAEKTVINRACWRLINSSDDSYLIKSARRSTVEAVEAEVEEDMLEASEAEELAIEAEAVEQAPDEANKAAKSSGIDASEVPF